MIAKALDTEMMAALITVKAVWALAAVARVADWMTNVIHLGGGNDNGAAFDGAKDLGGRGAAGDQVLAVECSGVDDRRQLLAQGGEFQVQSVVRILIHAFLAGLHRLALHLGEKVGDGLAGVDGDIDN